MNFMRACATLALAGSSLAASAAPVIAGCPVFPADNVWNTPVDTLPAHASSSAWISTIGATTGLHADFGTSYLGEPIGIPFVTVPSTQPAVPVSFDYADESDPGPYPIPPSAPIEGGAAASGDRHVLVLRTGTCDLFELFAAFPVGGGSSWTAGSGAHFDLRANGMRPDGWTSADAAGLPILAGLLRYDEFAAGNIEHALRFTASRVRDQHIWPATHHTSGYSGTQYPPMGARFRLKASFDTSTYPAALQPVLTALKKYGMILADNGSNWYVSGEHNDSWNDSLLGSLRQLKGSDFEAVDTSGLVVSPTSSQAVQPAQAPPAPPPGKSHLVDFNADGKADLVLQRADGKIEVRLMQGTSVIAAANVTPGAPGHVLPTTGDFNGDGKGDLLYARDDGAVEMWLMDGTTRTATTTLVAAGTGVQVSHVGDFNGDGKSDVLLRGADGSVALWLMDGSTVASRASLMPAGASWVPQLVGDFNADGNADIVWRDVSGAVSMWLMNGGTIADRGPLLGVGNPYWPIQAGDFNHDGKSDLVLQSSDGSAQLWLMNGRTASAKAALLGPNASWTVTQVGDFNGDGNADLVWSAGDGTVGMWLMNGTSVVERKTEMGPGTGYRVSVADDLSGDRKSDLVWSNTNGAVGAWVMAGTAIATRAPLEPAGSTNKVIPLRFHH